MKTAKSFYRKKITATDNISMLNIKLAEVIKSYGPQSVLEFGAGIGKNLELLKHVCFGITRAHGLELNHNAVLRALRKRREVVLGDESTLTLFAEGGYDVVFTCSVLCHMPDAQPAIVQLKRIARKAVVIVETLDDPDWRYFAHDYEQLHGFRRLEYEYFSDGNNRRYHIWVFEK